MSEQNPEDPTRTVTSMHRDLDSVDLPEKMRGFEDLAFPLDHTDEPRWATPGFRRGSYALLTNQINWCPKEYRNLGLSWKQHDHDSKPVATKRR